MKTFLKKLLSFFYQKESVIAANSTEIIDISRLANSSIVVPAVKDELALSVRLEFKSKRDLEEFPQLDERLQAIVFWTAYTMKKFWNHQSVITSVIRSKSEQAALVKQGKSQKSYSPHMEGRAVDIRLNDFQAKERHVPILLEKLNHKWPRNDGFRTALTHSEGSNYHLHLQVPAQPKEA